MDIELLKTFLEVSRTRHFSQAAENLFITQSAVSARIRMLEETLGATLFTRTRNNIQLTPTGRRLVKHAESIVGTWNRARQELSVNGLDTRTPLTVGAVPGLWDLLLSDWIQEVYRTLPDILVHAESLAVETLVRRLQDGSLDLGFMLESPMTAELAFERFATLRLLMVSPQPELRCAEAVRSRYVFVDWGAAFATAHAKLLPDLSAPAIRVGPGGAARSLLLECGGAGYLPVSVGDPDVAAGRLFVVEDAPQIDCAAYAVYSASPAQQEVLRRVLGCLGTGRGVQPPLST